MSDFNIVSNIKSYNDEVVKEDTDCKRCNCLEFNPQVCCQIIVKRETYLTLPALILVDETGILVNKKIRAKIERVCAEKVIICGILRIELIYTAVDKYGKLIHDYKKIDDVKFRGFINRQDSNADCNDCFEVVGASVICNVCSKPVSFDYDHNKKLKISWKFKEEDIVKVCVRKVTENKDICID